MSQVLFPGQRNKWTERTLEFQRCAGAAETVAKVWEVYFITPDELTDAVLHDLHNDLHTN